MELAPNLYRVGDDVIACYLVTAPEGVTVIDAGLGGMYGDLVRELASAGRSIEDVRGIVLTHGDSDHIGFAERLRSERGIPVYVGEADAARARGQEKTSPSWGPMRWRATLGFLWHTVRKGGLRNRPLSEVVPVTDGEVLDLPGSPRIIGLPGHSPGSVAIHVPAVDAVFVGDGLTTRQVLTGAIGPAPAPFTDEPALALASLGRLAAIDATWVLPGHGPAWSGGTRAIVEAVRAAAARS